MFILHAKMWKWNLHSCAIDTVNSKPPQQFRAARSLNCTQYPIQFCQGLLCTGKEFVAQVSFLRVQSQMILLRVFGSPCSSPGTRMLIYKWFFWTWPHSEPLKSLKMLPGDRSGGSGQITSKSLSVRVLCAEVRSARPSEFQLLLRMNTLRSAAPLQQHLAPLSTCLAAPRGISDQDLASLTAHGCRINSWKKINCRSWLSSWQSTEKLLWCYMHLSNEDWPYTCPWLKMDIYLFPSNFKLFWPLRCMRMYRYLCTCLIYLVLSIFLGRILQAKPS